MIRVLIVDDSAFMRHSVTRAISAQADMEVAGTARDGIEALQLARSLRPDVITLDVEMPRLDGLKTLEVLMRESPLPVVMLSSLTGEGAPATIRALELGAVDFVQKPAPPAIGVTRVEEMLVQAVRTAVQARIRRTPPPARSGRPAVTPHPKPPRPSGGVAVRPERVVVIGCSTGGPRALMEVVPHLPGNLPAAVLIVQHMPAGFTRSLAERLDQASALHVREAEHGDMPAPGLALLAPGGRHMRLGPDGRVQLTDSPPVHGVRPSVDVLLDTLPFLFGKKCAVAILTGMGSDGADGAAAVKAAGGHIVAEHQSTTAVYGMPRAVVERGLAEKVAPLPDIARILCDVTLAERTGAATRQTA